MANVVGRGNDREGPLIISSLSPQMEEFCDDESLHLKAEDEDEIYEDRLWANYQSAAGANSLSALNFVDSCQWVQHHAESGFPLLFTSRDKLVRLLHCWNAFLECESKNGSVHDVGVKPYEVKELEQFALQQVPVNAPPSVIITFAMQHIVRMITRPC